MSEQTTLDWVVAAVAAVGLGLSLYNTIVQLLAKRPRLNVAARRGTLVELPPSKPPQLFDGLQVGGTPVMYFKVTNPQQKALRITELYLVPPSGSRLRLPYIHGDRELPCMVDPVDSTRFWVALEYIGVWLRDDKCTGEVTVKVAVKDVLDNTYTDEFRVNADNPVAY
jgi:hypothetical protein